MKVIKGIFFTLLGLILGLGMTILFLGGGLFFGATRVVDGLIYQEDPSGTPIPAPAEGRDSGGGWTRELRQMVSDIDLSRGLSLSSEGLERLLASAAADVGDDTKAVQFTSLDVEIQENCLKGTLFLSVPLERKADLPWQRAGLSPPAVIPTAVGFTAILENRAESMIIRLTTLTLGDMDLPAWLSRVGRSFLADWGDSLPLGVSFDAKRLSLEVPYEVVNDGLQGLARIRDVSLKEDSILITLVLETKMLDSLTQQAKPLLLRDGRRAVDVMNRIIPEENKEAAVKAEKLLEKVEAWGGVEALREAAVLTYREGEVLLFENREPRELEIGSSLPEGGVVKTGPLSAAELSLKDGTLIRLDANTQFTLTHLPLGQQKGKAGSTAVSMAYGSFRAVVNKLSPGASFSAEVPGVVMGVRGTDFTAAYTERSGFEAVVLEGAVELDPDNSDPVELTFDQRVELSMKELEEQYIQVEPKRLRPADREELLRVRRVRSRSEDAQDLVRQKEVVEIMDLVQELLAEWEEMDPVVQENLAQELEALISVNEWEALAKDLGDQDWEALLKNFQF